MNKTAEKIKLVTIRVPHSQWEFMRRLSIEQEKPMSKIILNSMAELEKKLNKSKKDVDML